MVDCVCNHTRQINLVFFLWTDNLLPILSARHNFLVLMWALAKQGMLSLLLWCTTINSLQFGGVGEWYLPSSGGHGCYNLSLLRSNKHFHLQKWVKGHSVIVKFRTILTWQSSMSIVIMTHTVCKEVALQLTAVQQIVKNWSKKEVSRGLVSALWDLKTDVRRVNLDFIGSVNSLGASAHLFVIVLHS